MLLSPFTKDIAHSSILKKLSKFVTVVRLSFGLTFGRIGIGEEDEQT